MTFQRHGDPGLARPGGGGFEILAANPCANPVLLTPPLLHIIRSSAQSHLLLPPPMQSTPDLRLRSISSRLHSSHDLPVSLDPLAPRQRSLTFSLPEKLKGKFKGSKNKGKSRDDHPLPPLPSEEIFVGASERDHFSSAYHLHSSIDPVVDAKLFQLLRQQPRSIRSFRPEPRPC